MFIISGGNLGQVDVSTSSLQSFGVHDVPVDNNTDFIVSFFYSTLANILHPDAMC